MVHWISSLLFTLLLPVIITNNCGNKSFEMEIEKWLKRNKEKKKQNTEKTKENIKPKR